MTTTFTRAELEAIATPALVAEYQRTSERFVLCLDALELSLVADGDGYCSRVIDRLEDIIEERISQEGAG